MRRADPKRFTLRLDEAGTVAFVAAGETHRFEDLSDDFAVWVLFYGPDGGESS